MRYLIGVAGALCLFAFVSGHSAHVLDEAKEGDFPAWNTWKLACKGDWIHYDIGGMAGSKYEILDVADGKVSYVRISYDSKGKETNRHPLNLAWDRIRLPTAMPKAYKVEWRDDSDKVCGIDVKCRVARYTTKSDTGGEQLNELWYSADLPCGGMVKTIIAGSQTLTVNGFAFNGKSNRGEDGKPLTVADPMPRFYAKAGNESVYKISRNDKHLMYQRRTVSSTDADIAKYEVTACDAEGNVAENATKRQLEQARRTWHADYKDPVEKDVKLKVQAGEFTCNVYKADDLGAEVRTWISDGVIVKTVRTKDGEATVMELVKLTLK